VHKIPVTLRPVVSSSSSFLSIFSNWLDYKMKDLLPLVRSYIKNSSTVLDDLQSIILPENTLLFSADAKSMYTNIDTPTGISAIRDFIAANIAKLPPEFPTSLFLRILSYVMEKNIFTFAGTHWLQLSGTAMGTPAACAYATISFGHHENSKILPTFQPQLLYFKRYIDDIFGIWIPPTKNRLATWKDMNLYLYIPPSSAHPPSCLKGLIAGELRHYFIQNNREGFEGMLTKFIHRLLDRGHSLDNILPILLQAATNLDNRTQRVRVKSANQRYSYTGLFIQKVCKGNTYPNSMIKHLRMSYPFKKCRWQSPGPVTCVMCLQRQPSNCHKTLTSTRQFSKPLTNDT
jgi:hypothetical protein